MSTRPTSQIEPLSPRQRRFVEEYLVDLNPSRAAKRAGFRGHAAGSRLMSYRKVIQAIDEAMAARSERVRISADWVVEQLRAVAASDVRKLYDADGKLKPLEDIDDETAAGISGIEVSSVGKENPVVTRKVRRWDKVQALIYLGRHLGMFGERPGPGETPGYLQRLGEARERIERRIAGLAGKGRGE